MMSRQTHVVELLPDLITRSLEPLQATRVHRHLARCRTCRAERQRLQQAFDSLGMLAPLRDPAPELRRRILAGLPQRIRAMPAAARFLSQHPKAAIVASIFIVCVLAASVGLNVRHYAGVGGIRDPLASNAANQILTVLHGTEVAPLAHGMIVVAENHTRGVLLAFGLPVPPEGYAYQLWLIRNDERASGGVFRVTSEGHAVHRIQISEPLSRFPSFRITVEPDTGSEYPTGDRIMDGSLETVNM